MTARPHLVFVVEDSMRDPSAFFGRPLRKVPPAHLWRWRASCGALKRYAKGERGARG